MKYRVDNLPRHLAPLVKAYGKIGGATMTSWMRLSRSTSQFDFVRLVGGDHDDGGNTTCEQLAPYDGPCIHATWHENIPTYVTYYHLCWKQQRQQTQLRQQQKQQQQRHVWLQHPAVYMKPVHQMLEWLDIEYVLGSSGHGGQDALNQIIQQLSIDLDDTTTNKSHDSNVNWCTAMFPDGPYGPTHQCKLGVIQLASATNLPIIPIRFQFTSSYRVGWDQKHLAKFGSKITVLEYPPLWVTESSSSKKDDMAQAAQKLQDILNHGLGHENRNNN